MNREKIASTLNRINISSFPIYMELRLNPECPDGLTRVSAALRAPDVNADAGIKVETGIKAGGLWPPHSVVLTSDDESVVVSAAREAAVKALGHEVDEHLKFDGVIVNNPHA